MIDGSRPPEHAGSETRGSLEELRRLRAYREEIQRRFPALSRAALEAESISDTDALALGHFLAALPGDAIVLDVGTFLGIAAVHVAGLPNVVRVVIPDLGPLGDVPVGELDNGPLAPRELLGPDATEQALDLCQAERAKIELGSEPWRDVQRQPAVATPAPVLVALLERRRSREAVRAGLEAVFRSDPEALAIVDDCRHRWGPFVQAGIAGLLEGAPGRYRFRLFCDLGPALAGCDLGVVYAAGAGASTDTLLARFAESFSRRFDLLGLLTREAALIEAMGRRGFELAEAHRRTEEARTQLERVIGSWTWRLTEPARAAAGAARRLFRRVARPGDA